MNKSRNLAFDDGTQIFDLLMWITSKDSGLGGLQLKLMSVRGKQNVTDTPKFPP